jgi:hypothetical protein
MGAVVLYGPTGQPLIPPTPAVVEPTAQALRIVPRAAEYQYPGSTYGHYRAYAALAAALWGANAALLAFRFAPSAGTPGGAVAVLNRLRASAYVATAVTAQRIDPIVAAAARGYTTAETTNTAAVALSGNNAKMRTTPMQSAASTIVAASAAAGVSGGVKAVDATPFGHMPIGQNGTAGLTSLGTGVGPTDLFENLDNAQHPLVMAANEGFVVSWGATALATGTAIVVVEVEWYETLTY